MLPDFLMTFIIAKSDAKLIITVVCMSYGRVYEMDYFSLPLLEVVTNAQGHQSDFF